MNTDTLKTTYDVIIIGAGAAGLMCAIRAGERGLSVLVLDKAEKPGKKILISGGGRCNFTNLAVSSENYLSPNQHFCKSALSRYTPWHFIELLSQHGLTYNEKTLGQLFCQQQSKAVVEMLLAEAQKNGVEIHCQTDIYHIDYHDQYTLTAKNILTTKNQQYRANHLVVACGGPSIPKLGASDFALQVAKQFQIKNTPFSPALVPLTLPHTLLQHYRPLAGISQPVSISCNGVHFTENLLFTHRGISGPAVLQISSYWQKGDILSIDFCPTHSNLFKQLQQAKSTHPKLPLSRFLAQKLAKKFAQLLATGFFTEKPLQQFDDTQLMQVANHLKNWEIQPSGSEGMKKAEVSKGGIHPDALSSKTFECKQQPHLYFIGEAVDVTGWLGGYNFQWAWSSGWCCGDGLSSPALAKK